MSRCSSKNEEEPSAACRGALTLCFCSRFVVLVNHTSPPQVWSEMSRSGVVLSARAWSARVTAQAKGGRIRRALKLGKEMREHGHPWGVVTYTSLIAGCTWRRNYTG